jgi:hemoglobin/transferrin/lactoferrin receptor protein
MIFSTMKRSVLASCLLMIPFFCWSQNQKDSLRTEVLKELVFSANRFEEDRKFVAQQIESITLPTIVNLNMQSTADLLMNTGTVTVQKSQQGGGSPVLRGFEASRVLLVIDGVRLNNLIYRAGHLQNVITVDNNMIERAEVLFGPSSTVYGSDALGGVIHFKTKDPELATASQTTNFFGNSLVRLGSSNREKTAHVDFNIGWKKLASLTSFTYSDFDDLRMGEKINPSYGKEYGLRKQYVVRADDNQSDVLVQNTDPYLQKFSGYSQYDLLQKFVYKQSNTLSHKLNFQYSNSSNIPRYDRLTDPNGSGLRSAAWYYGPQERLLMAYSFNADKSGKWADHIQATISYQAIEESRNNRRFNNNTLRSQIENVDVLGVNIDFQKSMHDHSFRYGLDGQFNWLTSTAMARDITTGEKSDHETRYPDGDNTMHQVSVYGTHTYHFSEKLTLNDGIRIGRSSMKSTFVDKSFFPFPFDDVTQNNTIVSANLGFIYTPADWKISLMGSTGYRVPNIDDLSKVFESSPGNLIVPNPNVNPEKTLNLDLAITKKIGSILHFENIFYVTRFYDAIVVDNFTFNGQSTIDYDGTSSNVLAAQNKQTAYIRGYSGTLRTDISKHFIVSATLNYTYGRVKTDSTDAPLDHIAPTFGRISAQYKTDKLFAELFVLYNGWKTLDNYSSSGEDNLQYATPRGIPSWYTLNLRVGYALTKHVTIQTGVDNLFDLQYRTFASGINASGRNIFGALRVKF